MSTENPDHTDSSPRDETPDAASSLASGRRDFLALSSSTVMLGGLTVSYGTFAGMAGYFLYPPGPDRTTWMYVAIVEGFRVGESLSFQTPGGARIVVARAAEEGSDDDFIALSSVCPHLGCHVHWESNHDRFFCPCHNGAFNAAGVAIAGPPAEAGQSLSRYPLMIQNGLLFIEVPLNELQVAKAEMGIGSDGGQSLTEDRAV